MRHYEHLLIELAAMESASESSFVAAGEFPLSPRRMGNIDGVIESLNPDYFSAGNGMMGTPYEALLSRDDFWSGVKLGRSRHKSADQKEVAA